MLVNSFVFSIFFLGGWVIEDFGLFKDTPPLVAMNHFAVFNSIVVVFIASVFILVRALLPRYRFDQLMSLC